MTEDALPPEVLKALEASTPKQCTVCGRSRYPLDLKEDPVACVDTKNCKRAARKRPRRKYR